MEFNDVIHNRYSVRKFADQIVPQNLIAEILDAGRISPSAGNHQPVVVYVLNAEHIKKLESAPEARVHPVVFRSKQALMVCFDKTAEMKRPHDSFAFGITDASIVATYMTLKITELGLGSVWVGWFDPAVAKETLGIPAPFEVSSILPFGYIQKGYRPGKNHGKRKTMDEFVGVL